MNFDIVYEKYINGTATEEEKVYIEAEIAKARKLNAIIDSMEAKRPIAPAETEEVKRATKTMKKRFGLRALAIVLAVLIGATVLAVGTGVGYVHVRASSRAQYNRADCIELAKKSVADHSDVVSTELFVGDVDREIRFYNGKLSDATYVYEIEVHKGSVEYEVTVNTATGQAVIVDVD